MTRTCRRATCKSSFLSLLEACHQLKPEATWSPTSNHIDGNKGVHLYPLLLCSISAIKRDGFTFSSSLPDVQTRRVEVYVPQMPNSIVICIIGCVAMDFVSHTFSAVQLIATNCIKVRSSKIFTWVYSSLTLHTSFIMCQFTVNCPGLNQRYYDSFTNWFNRCAYILTSILEAS